MIIENGKVELKGKVFEVGGRVIANKNSKEYEGLTGKIVKILTEEHVDDNYDETENIIVSFEVPEGKLATELKERFSDVFQRKIELEDIILDEIVCFVDDIDICK